MIGRPDRFFGENELIVTDTFSSQSGKDRAHSQSAQHPMSIVTTSRLILLCKVTGLKIVSGDTLLLLCAFLTLPGLSQA